MFAGWQIWKRAVRLPVILSTDNGFRIIAYPESEVVAALVYYRVPEGRDIQFLRSHLDGGWLIDVGANIGSVSLLLADKIDGAILFEPNPIAAAQARENIALNCLSFEVHELGLSDEHGTVDFEDAGGANSCNRVVAGFKSNVKTRTVSRTTLDNFLSERSTKVKIAAVKIDVEGHENAVIRGMAQLLQKERPKLIMFEYLQRTNLIEAIASFRAARYKTFELTAEGPVEITDIARPLQNLFACPEELFQTLG